VTDLFDVRRQELLEKEQPLAARMRPRSLDEFIGQDHLIGPGRLLRRAIQADQLSSLIFYGPPGTGKTTLARIIANTTRAHFIAINAVLAGVKDIREAIATAQERRGMYEQKTILFVDEVHRFNKAQQDALLPHVENGTVILIGATTENPYFEVNKALVSRSRIFQLKSLNEDDLRQIALAALQDSQRGYGALQVQLDPQALDHLANIANGDARAVLNALELAVETTPPDDQSVIHIDIAVAEESIQRRAVLYDKEGDAHFDTVSAFIKSLRGSDPDAALYWLAKMVYAGEDPRFIFRRMLIFAGEDVGLADPAAVGVVNACARAFDYVGLPEGRFHLAEACLYLATAPKSNSSLAFFDALKTVEQQAQSDVPSHLRDASRDRKGFGHGEGYLYPHAYRDHWVAQQYLPDSLQGKVFYNPGDQGFEAQLASQVARRRQAQLAAMVEGMGSFVPEILTFAGEEVDPDSERWLQRTLGNAGQQLAAVRDRVMALARIQRHHVLLDLNAGSGLLLWEAVRQAPEGGIFALASTAKQAAALQQMASSLPELRRPTILTGPLPQVHELVQQAAPEVRFDIILGRNALGQQADQAAIARQLPTLLAPAGRLILAETVPRYTQRIYQLVDSSSLAPALRTRWQAAEEVIYHDPHDAMVQWDEESLGVALQQAGFAVELQAEAQTLAMRISPALLDRWFGARPGGRPSYATRLAQSLTPDEVAQIEAVVRAQLSHRTVSWHSTIAYVQAVFASS